MIWKRWQGLKFTAFKHALPKEPAPNQEDEQHDWHGILTVGVSLNEKFMDKVEKFKSMEKILREIEDLKNSETAVIKKIGQIETENMNVNIQELEKSITLIYDGAYKNLENIEGLHTSFTETVSDFKEKNNITDEMLLELRESN
jgi:GTP-dependent phosphoenolpyruvate carboxykinase